jgi:hypothetical protein
VRYPSAVEVLGSQLELEEGSTLAAVYPLDAQECPERRRIH